MVLRRFRKTRDSEARRYAYSRWDGSQSGFDLHAMDLLAELTDELIHHGDPNSALRNLLQQGFEVDGDRVQGLREILEQLAREREERLENHNLGGVFEEIAQELKELVDDERSALDRLAADAQQSGDERRGDLTQNTVTEKHMQPF